MTVDPIVDLAELFQMFSGKTFDFSLNISAVCLCGNIYTSLYQRNIH